MQLVRAIRLAALRAVLNQRVRDPKPDPEYFMRYVMRWYSKKFFTPLDQVEQLPLEDILQAYYEERFEEMDDDHLEKERIDVLKTDEDLEKEARERDAQDFRKFDDELWAKRTTEEENKRREERKRKKELEKQAKQGLEVIPAAQSGLNAGMSKQSDLVPLADLKQAPPSISMEFVTEEELGLDGDTLGILDTPKRQG